MAAQNPYGIAPVFKEDIGGDSMTKFMRSLDNTLGQSGQGAFGTGTNTYGAGQKQYGQAIQQTQPVMDYLTKLVKGDQADVQQAEQPGFDAISQQFDAIRGMIASQPRGGGKAGVLAEIPFKEAQQKATMANTARAQAAPELGSLGTQLAGLGVSEQGMGLGEQGLGLQGMQDAAGNNLTRRGQNMGPGSFGAQFSAITSGISNLAGAAATII